jgi:predicted DNA-binding transcriptional regulator AlpA
MAKQAKYRLADRVVRAQEMAEALGRSVRSLPRMESRGDIPGRISSPAGRPIGWRESDVNEFFRKK